MEAAKRTFYEETSKASSHRQGISGWQALDFREDLSTEDRMPKELCGFDVKLGAVFEKTVEITSPPGKSYEIFDYETVEI